MFGSKFIKNVREFFDSNDKHVAPKATE